MTKRELTFSDGKSNKFWNIEVDGKEFLVSYGRTGTTGQTQTKSFDSESAAQSAADKLIAEKEKKGYVEATNPTGASVAARAAKSAAPKTVTKSTSKLEPQNQTAFPEAVVDVAASSQTDWDSQEERVLNLDARDWLWATWRPCTPEVRASLNVKPFDKEDALKRLAKVPGKHGYSSWEWNKAKLAPILSREEAHFWLVAMTTAVAYDSYGYQAKIQNEFLPKIAAQDYDGSLGANNLSARLQKTDFAGYRKTTPLLVYVLSHLVTPIELVDLMLSVDANSRSKRKHHHQDLEFVQNVCEGFRQHLLPFLTPEETELIRARLRSEVSPSKWPTDFYEPPVVAFHLAALLGMPDEISAVVRSWKDDFYIAGDDWHDHYHRPQEIVFGLGSEAEVETQMRRLRLQLTKPEHVRAWLAHTEFSAPDWVKEGILAAKGQSYGTSAKDVAEALTKTFALAQAPEIAPPMLQLLLESKAARPAREWLDAHPSHTIRGLVPVATGRGKLAEAAVELLRSLQKRGAQNAIREAGKSLPEDERARLQSAVLDWSEKTYEPFTEADTPEEVKDALRSAPKLMPAKTTWIHVSDLPPITYGARRLNDSQVEALLSALHQDRHVLTLAVKNSADRASLDAFAWKLFERWLGESAPPKEKWAMLAVGQLGGDSCALKLTPLIRAWPGEAQHARAVTGLDCLRAIGTDTALMQINGIAQKVKFKGLQGKAVEAMEGIAADRGLSRGQLEDRVVPTLDLDERGTRIFDFGPRQFRFVLSPDMKPLVREEGAALTKPRPNLPKPTGKDDETLAQAALAEWKLLKKQIAELVKIQAVRLENAMVRGRRWTPDEFELLFARHPLMQNLARLLVWEAASGNRRATFRVTEDVTYADQNDEQFDLRVGEWAHIGIAHPLHLSDAEKAAWGEILSDYEIVPPFAQLGRQIYSLEGDEGSGTLITRFKDIAVPPETLNFGLEKLDWQVGGLHDHGDYYEHSKLFESAGVNAWVHYEPGLFKGYRDGWEPQKMVRCFFLPADTKPRIYDDANEKDALPLADIDAIAVSEVLKDLNSIAAKGEVKA